VFYKPINVDIQIQSLSMAHRGGRFTSLPSRARSQITLCREIDFCVIARCYLRGELVELNISLPDPAFTLPSVRTRTQVWCAYKSTWLDNPELGLPF